MKKNSNEPFLSDFDNDTSIEIEHSPVGWRGIFTGKNTIYSLTLAGGVALHAINMYITITIMPSIIADIGGLNLYAWTTTLFVVTSILGAAITSKLLSNNGPRGAYIIATIIFALGTIICSLSTNMPTMLIGRTIQGLGGGFLYALAYGVTRLIFPEKLWVPVIGLISAMFGVATLVGPTIGGVFAEYGAWRAAFWFLLPFIATLTILAFISLPKHKKDDNEVSSIPFVQLCLLIGSVLVVSIGSLSSNIVWNLVSLVFALVFIALIAFIETRTKSRLLPKRSFNIFTPLGALYLMIALLMISMQPELFAPYLLQKLHNQSPLLAGYISALMAIGWTIGTLSSSRWQGKSDNKFLFGGPALVFLGLILFGLFMPIHSTGNLALLLPICLGLLFIGFGIGIAWPNIVNRIFQNAPEGEQSLAVGGMTTIQLFAIAFGTACAGMVANFAGIANPGGLLGASNAALWLSCTFAIAPVLCIIITINMVRLTSPKG